MTEEVNSILTLTYTLQNSSQLITYSILFFTLMYNGSSEMIELVKTGCELEQMSQEKESNNKFFKLIVLKIFFLEWVNSCFIMFSNYEMIIYPKIVVCSMLVTMLGNTINMFAANIFFCGLYWVGKLYKTLNKQLKAIVKPLTNDQKLSLSQLLELSEKVDQMMIQHAKIGKFVEEYNKIFSLFCAAKLLEAFVTITVEVYSFYIFSRTSPDDGSSPLSFYLVLVQISTVFSFVYASSFVTEHFQKTGDLLKVFLDNSVDDRVRNSVRTQNFQILFNEKYLKL